MFNMHGSEMLLKSSCLLQEWLNPGSEYGSASLSIEAGLLGCFAAQTCTPAGLLDCFTAPGGIGDHCNVAVVFSQLQQQAACWLQHTSLSPLQLFECTHGCNLLMGLSASQHRSHPPELQWCNCSTAQCGRIHVCSGRNTTKHRQLFLEIKTTAVHRELITLQCTGEGNLPTTWCNVTPLVGQEFNWPAAHVGNAGLLLGFALHHDFRMFRSLKLHWSSVLESSTGVQYELAVQNTHINTLSMSFLRTMFS
jgi:hypothetical protein